MLSVGGPFVLYATLEITAKSIIDSLLSIMQPKLGSGPALLKGAQRLMSPTSRCRGGPSSPLPVGFSQRRSSSLWAHLRFRKVR